jgi:hypothetical protein
VRRRRPLGDCPPRVLEGRVGSKDAAGARFAYWPDAGSGRTVRPMSPFLGVARLSWRGVELLGLGQCKFGLGARRETLAHAEVAEPRRVSRTTPS